MEGGGDVGHGGRKVGRRQGLEVAGVRHGEWGEEDDATALSPLTPTRAPDILTAAIHVVCNITASSDGYNGCREGG